MAELSADTELRRLLRSLQRARGFRLLLVVGGDRERAAVVERMRQEAGLERLDAAALLRALAGDDRRDAGAVVPDGDALTTRGADLQRLNVARDQLVHLFGGPLVLVLSAAGARRLAERAPDLYDVRAASFEIGGVTRPPGKRDSAPRYDVFLAHASADKDAARELYDALSGDLRVFLDEVELLPGDSWDREIPRAQAQSALTVVLCSRATDQAFYERDEIAAALAQARADPTGHRVVPVWLDAGARRAPPYGLRRLHGIDRTALGSAEAVAEAIRETLRRTRRPRGVRVSVVAHRPELESIQDQVVHGLDRLQQVAEVESVDARASGLPDSDLTVVLVGVRGGEALGRWVELDQSVVLAWDFPREILDDDTAFEQFGVTRRLHKNRPLFESAEQATDLAATAVADWIRAHRPAAEGDSPVLEPWERQYLEQRLPGWEKGRHGPLQAKAGSRAMVREQLYVSLRATRDRVVRVDDQVVLLPQGDPGDLAWVGRLPPGLAASMLEAAEEHLAESQLVVGLRALRGLDPEGGLPKKTRVRAERLLGRGAGGLEGWARSLSKKERVRLGQAVVSAERSVRQQWSPAYLEEALCVRQLAHLMVEGEAGSGKTVLLQHVATVLARSHLAQRPPDHHLDLIALASGRPILPVPVLLEARQLAQALAGAQGLAGVVAAVRAELHAATCEELDAAEVRTALLAGRILLMIDSLDEVPTLEGRAAVARCLEGVAQRESGEPRFVLTSRPAAHTGVGVSLPVLRIAPLDDELVARMVRRWQHFRGRSDRYGDELMQALLQAGGRHGRANFLQNPLMLTAAMLVYDRDGVLPDSTAVLYRDLVEILCQLRETTLDDWQVSADDKRKALELVFEGIQAAGGTTWPVREAAAALHRWRPEQVSSPGKGELLLERLDNDTGLLRFEHQASEGSERPQRVVRAWHRSFQEYLAARRLVARGIDVEELVRGGGEEPARVADPAWEGVFRFLVGVLGSLGDEKAQEYVAALYHQAMRGADRPGRLLGLAARAIDEYPALFQSAPQVDGVPLREQIAGVVRRELARAADAGHYGGNGWPLADRLLALEAIGRLPDPDWPDPLEDTRGWVWIEGSDRVAGFWLYHRPVTVADYTAFLEETGHQQPGDWMEQSDHPLRPVVMVSWLDAVDFCEWARQRWRCPDGAGELRLPLQDEWRIASFSEGPMDPGSDAGPERGDEACANLDLLLRSPSPVGAFPRGSRPGQEGAMLLDLTSNVDEWTSDPLRDGPVPGRSMGGCSFATDTRARDLQNTMSAQPSSSFVDVGFRLCCSGPKIATAPTS